jgi:hypothetical protein
MLAALLRPDAGTARIFGHDVDTDEHIVRQLIGLTGQYASFLTLTGHGAKSAGPTSRRPRRARHEHHDAHPAQPAEPRPVAPTDPDHGLSRSAADAPLSARAYKRNT